MDVFVKGMRARDQQQSRSCQSEMIVSTHGAVIPLDVASKCGIMLSMTCRNVDQ